MTNDFFDDPEEDFSDDNFSSDFDDDHFIEDASEAFQDDLEEDSLGHDDFDAMEEHPLHPNDVDHPDIGFGSGGKDRSPSEASGRIEAAFNPADPTKAGSEVKETEADDSSAFVSFIRDIFQRKSK